ncbi:MAG TPA: plastocyanin/azurin family copper-binding protein [Gemmatimonadales bacterium]
MRFSLIGTLVALGALACGGGERQAEQTPAGGQPAATPPSAPVVEVRMTGNGTNQAAFEPAAITIAPGTTVRFINATGGPHNVAFWGDSIPAGAAAVLNAAMPDRLNDLSSRFVTTPSEALDIAFAGAPTGVYKAYCLPHLAMGMRLTITVQ